MPDQDRVPRSVASSEAGSLPDTQEGRYGGHEASSAATTERKRVYMVKRTLVERCFYDPDEIRREFGFPAAALPDESFEDFVIRVFERFEGSVYHDEFFPGDASPEVYTELEERWDDE